MASMPSDAQQHPDDRHFLPRLARRWHGAPLLAKAAPDPQEYIMRPSGRAPDQMRAIIMEPGFTRHAEGSCLVSFGDTRVLCTASVETNLPAWLRGKGRGWVTAEYGMLPRATHTRGRREAAGGKQSGRTQEIQRLIGRSLARRRRSRSARRAPDHARLRRHPGRRRHPHRRDFRRLGGAAARGRRAAREEADRGRSDPPARSRR